MGSIVSSRGRLGRHTEVFGGTTDELQRCRHAPAEAIAPHSPVAGLGAARSARSPRPGWRAAGLRRLGRRSRPLAQVEVESDDGQGVATAFSAWSGVTTQATKDKTAKATANTTGQRQGTRSGDHSDPAVAQRERSRRRSRQPATEPHSARKRRRPHERLVARIQPALVLFPGARSPRQVSRSQNDALPHRRLRPERFETTCTDWHLPPMAKGASP